MSEKSGDKSTPPEAAQSHIQDLVGAGISDYNVFKLVESSKIPGEDVDIIRGILIKIIEMNISGEFKQGEAICHTAGNLINKNDPERIILFKSWLDCLEKSDSNRSLIKSLFSNFSSIIDGLTEFSREFLDFLPLLFECYKKNALKIIPQIAGIMNKIPIGRTGVFFDLLKAYMPNITFKVFSALIPIASFLAGRDTPFKEKFEKLCTQEMMEEDAEAHKFIKSLGNALETFPETYEENIIHLNLVIGSESFSSACHVAKSLNKKIQNLETKFHKEYIEAFIRIIEKGGIRMIHFCLNSLPKLFSENELDLVRKYIDTLLTISSNYGPYAGFCFSQGETPTSKKFLKYNNYEIRK